MGSLLSVDAILFFLVFFRVSEELKEKTKNLNKEAKALYRDKNYGEATAKFKEVLKIDSKNKSALKYLKRISQKMEEEKQKREGRRIP